MPACETVVNPVHENSDVSAALAIVRRCRICEFTTVSPDGTPQTSPVSALLLDDARILVSTSIGFPQKAFNVRRNPKVCLRFPEPTGSGLDTPGAVLIRGVAVVEDRMVSDVTERPELPALAETIFERQPSSSLMSSFVGRRLFFPYHLRLSIYVTLSEAWYWPGRDFGIPPLELDLKEFRHVASNR
jgi:general stress protein 26